MIAKIDGHIMDGCQQGNFLEASKLFHRRCKNNENCLCRGKDLKDLSMCMISHLQHFAMMEDENLSEEILENYMCWRSTMLAKKHSPAPEHAKKNQSQKIPN